ncbi:hypothetical protein RJO15_19845 [Herbaspirillum huttiense F1]|uniref:hypothetical protein n=1 Tax=Herbaspirillum sp. 1130 TaxID=2806562 RepID=UPI0010670E6E|nr:hypothetical protein [Herbaspirillum sp. 1130]MDT0358050.1 hypothetical protein [Herbaspirillum huttiense F1]
MSTSRFNPPNSLWYEDLPARAAMAEEEVSVMALQEDVIGVDQDKLDISRASSILRGGFIFTGMAVLLILCWFAPHVFTSIFTPPRSVLVITILTIQNLALAGYSLFLIWLDCRIHVIFLYVLTVVLERFTYRISASVSILSHTENFC